MKFRNFTLVNKLRVIILAPILSLLYFGIQINLDKFQIFQKAGTTGSVADISISLIRLIREVQKERGLSAGYLASGKESDDPVLADQLAKTDRAAAQYLDLLRNFERGSVAKSFLNILPGSNDSISAYCAKYYRTIEEIKSRIDSIRERIHDPSFKSEELVQLYTEQIVILTDSLKQIVNQDGSGFENVFRLLLVQAAEDSGRERALLNTIAKGAEISPAALEKAGRLHSQSRENLLAVQKYADQPLLEKIALLQQSKNTELYETIFSDVLAGNKNLILTLNWWEISTQRIESIFAIDHDIALTNRARADAQMKSAFLGMSFFLILLLITLSAALYLPYLLSQNISGRLVLLLQQLQKMTLGNLQERLTDESEDELGKLAAAANKLRENQILTLRKLNQLSGIAKISTMEINEIVDGNNQTVSGLVTISEENNALAEELNASFEDTTRIIRNIHETMRETDDSVQHFTESLGIVNTSIKKLESISQNMMVSSQSGSSKAQETGNAMKQILDSSARIHEVVDIINQISEKTSLLSLNASIEAARAGEYGRGFAVVASEISKLSINTSGGVKEIRDLVTASENIVKSGNHKVLETVEIIQSFISAFDILNTTIQEIVNALEKEADNSTVIAFSLADKLKQVELVYQTISEQKKALEHFTKSINQIAIESTSIAGISEKLKTLSNSLSEESEELHQLVQSFSLPD